MFDKMSTNAFMKHDHRHDMMECKKGYAFENVLTDIYRCVCKFMKFSVALYRI